MTRENDDLAQRPCLPCRAGVPPLTTEELKPLLDQLGPDWSVADHWDATHGRIKILSRRYPFRNFSDALDAAVRIGELAEQQQHHPDLHVAWGSLGIEVWTHKIGGLTESDFIFAAKCDALLAVSTDRQR